MTTDKPSFPSDAADKFVVRFPDGMRDQITGAAKAAGRSMNAEIVHRLESSFQLPEGVELLVNQLSDMHHQLELHRRVLDVSTAMPQILGRMLIKIIDRLTPEEAERFDGLPETKMLAQAIVEKDGVGMVDAWANILTYNDPKADVSEVRALRDDPLIAGGKALAAPEAEPAAEVEAKQKRGKRASAR